MCLSINFYVIFSRMARKVLQVEGHKLELIVLYLLACLAHKTCKVPY